MAKRALEQLENGLMLVACLAVCLVVGITAVDVGFRYGLDAPLSWAHDVVTQYLLIAMFFLSLPYVMRIGGHMSLDYIARRVTSPTMRGLLALLGDTVAFFVVIGIVHGGFANLIASYEGGDMLPDILPLPTWPSHAVVTLGAGVMSIRLLTRLVDTLVAISRGEHVDHLENRAH